MLAAIAQFHDAHDVCVGKGANDKGDEGSDGDARCQAEDGVEASVIVPVGCSWNPVAQRAHRHEEEVHGEAQPNQKPSLLESPHFAHAVVDDVTDWEHEKPTCQRDGSHGDLLCFEHVCCNQTNAEEDAEKHEQHAHLYGFLFHFLVFYEVYQALGFIINSIDGNYPSLPFGSFWMKSAAKLQLFRLTTKYLSKYLGKMCLFTSCGYESSACEIRIFILWGTKKSQILSLALGTTYLTKNLKLNLNNLT